jgi:hypothetical protein
MEACRLPVPAPKVPETWPVDVFHVTVSPDAPTQASNSASQMTDEVRMV